MQHYVWAQLPFDSKHIMHVAWHSLSLDSSCPVSVEDQILGSLALCHYPKVNNPNRCCRYYTMTWPLGRFRYVKA